MDYSDLVDVYEKLEKTTKRLEKTHILAEFLKTVRTDSLPYVVLLLQGNVYPAVEEKKIGVAAKLVLKAIASASGIPHDKVEHHWAKSGDLGETAAELMGKKKQSTLFKTDITVKKVMENLRKLATLEGEGTVSRKVDLISELLTSATSKEAKFIVRTMLEELRVGVADGTLRDAIVWAYFGKEIGFTYNQKENDFDVKDRIKYNEYSDAVQRAYDMVSDFSEVIVAAKEKGLLGLAKSSLKVGAPIKVMLYPKAEDFKEAFEALGKPAQCEFKFDGFRIQAHKKDGKITLFTRRLENVTKQFPDVVKFVEEFVKAKEFIIDSEAVGYDSKTKKYVAFQIISQRIKRKYDIEEIAKKFPVELDVFDVVEYEGENCMNKPFRERRKILEKMVPKEVPFKLKLAEAIVTSSEKEAEEFYQKSLQAGNEGVMVKSLDAPYQPGRRVGGGVKIKPVMETLDVVIVGAEKGEGKRAGWLSSFIIACRDEDSDELVEIGRVSTGFKEKSEEGTSFDDMTKLLDSLIVDKKGKIVKVRPKIIIEVAYEEIQKSPEYSSGYALRFPRLVRLREDRGPDDASTLREVDVLYSKQRGRHK
ncbi:TPA: ATP-dependent DNA ligase [Candidatus Woesearchaeota archaeon]|nr:ATP-dependent DNA ligase [Candidatus Woesearchaeota archaeon]